MSEPTDDEVIALLADAPRRDVGAWFGSCAMIRLETGEKVRAPVANILQQRVFEHYEERQSLKKGCKILILKPRRKGASTCSNAVMYHHNRRHDETNGTIMADKDGTSDEIYEIYRTYAEYDIFEWNPDEAPMPERGRPGNSDEDIILPNTSTMGKETAGSANAGRGGTRQNANLTECAFFQATSQKKDPTLAFLPSVQAATKSHRGVIIADSTPNGPSGWFYEQCTMAKAGLGEWFLIFAAWFEFDTSLKEFEEPGEREAFEASMEIPENAWFEEERELRLYGGISPITLEHLNWRRMIIVDECGGSVKKFRQEYPSDSEECFQASSEKRFNEFQIKRCRDKLGSNQGNRFSMNYIEESKSVAVHPDPKGEVIVYEEPRVGCRYMASGDFCTGADQQIGGKESDPDYHSLKIWRDSYVDQSTGRHMNAKLVAHHRSRVDIDLAAMTLAAMSQYYGRCFIIPEVNNCGLEPTHLLCKLGFPVYQRSKRDETTQQLNKAYGWSTDPITRKTIIDHFAKRFRDGELDVFDEVTLDEYNVFVVNKTGKPEAMAGKHDDTVLSDCINVYNCPSLGTVLREPRRQHFTLRQLMRNPRLNMPDGYARGGLSKRKRR